MSRTTGWLILTGLAIRLFLIFPGPLEPKVEALANKADLRNYYWPAQAALQGKNPYTLWANGQSGDYRADMAPLELAVYVAAAAIWNDPRAIQILFALFDAVNILLLGILLRDSPIRWPFQIFYALGPLTLYNLTLVPEDKTILLALTLLLLMLLLRGSHISIHVKQLNLFISNSMLCIFLAALVGAFKWLSVFYLLPLLVYLSHDTREFIKNMIWFCIWVALAHLPWFPAWSFVYAFRSARIAFPLHTAPAVLINALGVYSPALLLALLAISLFAIYGLFWLKHIDVFETIALSTMVGIWWTPDMDPVHLSVVVLMILLVIDWASRARQLAIWTLSFLVAAVYAISTHDGIARYGLQFFTGRYGSLQMILLSYPLFVGVLAFYLWDKWHRNAIGRAVIAPEVVER